MEIHHIVHVLSHMVVHFFCYSLMWKEPAYKGYKGTLFPCSIRFDNLDICSVTLYISEPDADAQGSVTGDLFKPKGQKAGCGGDKVEVRRSTEGQTCGAQVSLKLPERRGTLETLLPYGKERQAVTR